MPIWCNRRISLVGVAFTLVCASGCNNLLGLEISVADTDHDGIADVVDNCPLDTNRQQRDSDADGLGDACDCVEQGVDADGDGIDDACDDCVGEAIGADVGGDGIDDGCEVCALSIGRDQDADGIDDACDACSEGPPHDEDNDGIDDACDRCPSVADLGEPAAAGVLGLRCDRGTYSHQRFDPLTEQDITLWPGAVNGWVWQNDMLSVSGSGRTRFLLERATPATLVETAGSTDGSVALGCRSLVATIECNVNPVSQMLSLTVGQVGSDGGPIPPDRVETPVPPGSSFRLELSVDAVAGKSRCRLLDENGGGIAKVTTSYQDCTRISVTSTGTTTLRYLWIVNNDP